MKAVWTEPNPTYAGQFYTLNGAICDPPPVQRPHPPLWIGGEGDRVQRIAAKIRPGPQRAVVVASSGDPAAGLPRPRLRVGRA